MLNQARICSWPADGACDDSSHAPWRFTERPAGDYGETYWERLREMGLDPGGLDWQEYALRFTAFLPGVHSCIVGTRSVEHLRRNAEIVDRGPLPDDAVAAIRAAFRRHGEEWMGET